MPLAWHNESDEYSVNPVDLKHQIQAESPITNPLLKEMKMATETIQWSKIEADPRFRTLHARKSSFLWGLMAFSVVYYFLLPIGAAWFTDLYKIKVWGPVNVGLVFAFSQFIVAWGIAWLYSIKAAEFDVMAEEIAKDARGA
jgi:uncharacterized membrane protein (DUF485 family)